MTILREYIIGNNKSYNLLFVSFGEQKTKNKLDICFLLLLNKKVVLLLSNLINFKILLFFDKFHLNTTLFPKILNNTFDNEMFTNLRLEFETSNT